jgi:hypothetical protein
VESFHEGAALRISLLLADIHLEAGEPSKAAEIIAHMERAVGLAPPAARDTTDASSAAAAAASGSANHHEHCEDSPAAAQDAGFSTAASQPAARASPDAESISGSSTTSTGSTATGSSSLLELPVISKLASPMLEKVFALAGQQGSRVARPDSLLLVRLDKLRLLLACDNQRAAKRELKALTAAAPGCSALVLHKARLELQRHNHRRCLKLLASLLQVGAVLLLGCKAVVTAAVLLYIHTW